ncbi:sugar phosphate exchanger 3-like [Littorina saxatilis]|uniref:Sugar phosphate exchanger 3 n=1 Tax=Littorina saxatilis TaxID=31220 RepID=A0AAN9B8R7_9CAEN
MSRCIQGVRRAIQPYTRYHVSVFVLTFLSYAFFHATRKTFSNVKTTMAAEWTASPRNGSASECRSPSDAWTTGNESVAECRTPFSMWNKRHLFLSLDEAEEFMGDLDACFMFAYAVGLFVNGFIADRNDLRLVLSIGMALTSVSVFVFGCVFEWTHTYSKPGYIAVWLLNGFLQSTGWPSVVAVMGNWFGKGSRGLVMGVWSACASVGNIIGALLVATVLDFGYEYAFLMTSCVLMGGAILNFVGLVPSPIDVGLPMPHDEGDGAALAGSVGSGVQQPLLDSADDEEYNHPPLSGPGTEPVIYSVQDTRPKAIHFLTALLLPGVIPFSLCYAFLKLVNYSFFFWLPFYLHSAYGLPETAADTLSIWYDIGGIVGGTVAGFVSDRLQMRTIVVMPMLLAAVPLLFVYGMMGIAGTLFKNGLLLFFLGGLIGGVANLISAAISADLGRQKALKGNSEALSTVTGIIDGTGSLGAAVGQVAVPNIQVRYGWRNVFYLFMVSVFMTALCIARIFLVEIRQLLRRRRWLCGSGNVEVLRDLGPDQEEE